MCTASYQVQLISAKINLKVLASEAVGAFMKKEVKPSSFDNRWFTTLPMLCDNVIHEVSHKNQVINRY